MTEILELDGTMLAGAAELEKLCFSEPWSENSLGLLTREGGIGFAAVCDGVLAAYGGMTHVLDEGQITNIATHPDHRRRGLAEAVLGALFDYSKAHGLKEIFLEVRKSNAPAIALYKKCGFESVGERKNFYRSPTENAVLMKKILQFEGE